MYPELIDVLRKTHGRLQAIEQSERRAGRAYWAGEAAGAADDLLPFLQGDIACCPHSAAAPETAKLIDALETAGMAASHLHNLLAVDPFHLPEASDISAE